MPNVNLTAPALPTAGLPPEIAAQQMQLQVRQQIAEALLAKGMQDVDPVTHGPSGNPFAYDTVNIGGILSKMFNAREGRQQLERLGPEQLSLAARAEAMRKQDMAGVMQDYRGGTTPGPYEGGSIEKAPDLKAAISRALLSSHPGVQAWGEQMQKAMIEGELKGVVTPGDVASQGRNFTSRSIAKSLFSSPSNIGTRQNVGLLDTLGKIEKGEGGAMGLFGQDRTDPWSIGLGQLTGGYPPAVQPGQRMPLSPPGAISQPGMGAPEGQPRPLPGPGAPGADVVTSAVPSPVAPAGVPDQLGEINTTGSTLVPTAQGPKVAETATTEGGKKTAGDFRETLKAGKENSLEFIQTAPKLLKALELLPNADMKKGGNLITDARKWAVTMGMSTDNANKIGDTETFLKTMMSPATGAARAFNSRATQLEFVQFLKAFAASQDTDKRAAANIITQMLLDGVNEHTQHLKNIEQAKGIPGMENAAGYQLSNFPTIDSIAREMDKTRLKTDLKKDEATGLWSDALASQRGKDAYWPVPGPKAIEILKGGGSREKFDEYFGIGSSDAILGPAKE